MSTWKLIAILIVVTFFAYFSSFGNPFIWDDEQFIQKNVYVATFDIPKIFTTNTVAGAGVQSNYYRPFTSLSFAIDRAIWGLNSFPLHIVNTSIHIAAGVMLFLLLLELGFGNIFSFFISLFFLVDPLQTEAVTYINSRGDSLYALFLLSALYCFSKSFYGKKFYLFLSVLFFLSALLSKETALISILLFGLVFCVKFVAVNLSCKKFMITYKNQIVASVIVFSLSLLYVVLRLTVLNFGNTLNYYALQNIYSQNLFVRLFTFCKVMWIYIGLLLFPFPLHMERTVSYVTSFFSIDVISMILLILTIFIIGIFDLKKRKNVTILFGLFWFLIMLIPVSGIIPINGILYEHWLYLPMIGFFIMLFGLLQLIFHSLHLQSQLLAKIGIIVGTFLAVIYVFLTVRQNNIWSDPITFYAYTLSFNKTARVENNLAMAYDEKGDKTNAIQYYKDSLTREDTYQAHYNLGNTYLQIGKPILAEEELVKAYTLAPEASFIYPSLLNAYVTNNHFTKALPLAEKLSMTSYNNDIIFNLLFGKILLQVGEKDKAEEKFARALQLSNDNPQVAAQITNIKQGKE